MCLKAKQNKTKTEMVEDTDSSNIFELLTKELQLIF